MEPQTKPSGLFVHKNLSTECKNPARGRQVTCTAPISDGEIVLVDNPYTLVPAMMADQPPYYICSRQECHRRISRREGSTVEKLACLDNCLPEVTWCCKECQILDQERHRVECQWLRQFANKIRGKHGDSSFGLVWMVARILINKQIQPNNHKKQQRKRLGNNMESPEGSPLLDDQDTPPSSTELASQHFDKKGWDSVWNLAGSVDSFNKEEVNLWEDFAEEYLAHNHLLKDPIPPKDVVTLICKVETNSFGLYPGVTGEYPVISMISRGEYYGGGIYPTAAMFNHACCPNVSNLSAPKPSRFSIVF